MRIIDLHAMPLAYSNLDLNKQHQKQMNSFIKNELTNIGRVRSNVGGYQSDNLDFLKDPFLNLLKDIIEERANIFARDVMQIEKNVSLGNMWLNVNGYKDYNHSHVHPHSIISGAFYCQIPKEHSGPIRFNVNKDIGLYVEADLITNFNKYNSSVYDVFPKTFDMLLFPSWSWHEVRPNMNKKEKRITISFNCQ